jgi:putative FmdB family regulatory protein
MVPTAAAPSWGGSLFFAPWVGLPHRIDADHPAGAEGLRRPPLVDRVEVVHVDFIPLASRTQPTPSYEYSCRKCSRTVELLVRGDETPVCPHCRSTTLTKLPGVVSGHVANGGADADAAGGFGRPQCGLGGCAGLG